MNSILIHLTKSAVYIAALYMLYRLFLSRDTMYIRNRVFILSSVVAAFVLPFISFDLKEQNTLPAFGKVLSEILISGNERNAIGISGIIEISDGFKWVIAIYFTGVVIYTLKFLIDLVELTGMIATRKNRENHIIHFHNLNTSGFSAFGYIFINDRLTPEESDEIIRHEQNHLDRGHSADVLLIETAIILQWFNPFIYMFARSLRAVHEYQADNACLMTGISLTNYQGLLLNQVFRSRAFTITNSFSNPSLIKKRMIMMTRKPSGPLANLKLLLVVPVVASFLFAFSSCKEKVTNSELNKQESIETVATDGSVKVEAVQPSPEDAMAPPPPPPPPASGDAGPGKGTAPYEKVDVMPLFPGGDSEILKFIALNTVYPEKAKKQGIQGKVIVRFAVESDGTVDKISVFKSVDPDLDAEALRVIGKLPKFENPGLVNGKPVPVWYMIPINFALK